jgi:DNA-binding NarL/FixJ family response regulator
MRQRLLSLIEAGGYPDFRPLYEQLGFEVVTEFSVRRAQARLRAFSPDVLVADFHRRYFHDRVSNLESLLAIRCRLPTLRIIVIHDPIHEADVARLKLRCPIDIVLPLPISPAAMTDALRVR